jgi:lipoprotein-anchoring transpeptidase ErfK/SrfK
MQSRRKFLTALAAAPLSACNTVQNGGANFAAAGGVASAYVGFSSEERKPVALPSSRRAELARETVSYGGGEQPGTIVIATSERRLYLVLSGGAAIRYPVGVGRAGKQWQGRAEIEGKHVQPAWSPPDEIKRDNPRLPDVIPGGAPNNPMGVAAMTLSGGEQYAIHGTNRPESIGKFATYGCIRMFNEDIADLFGRVRVGTPVVVQL